MKRSSFAAPLLLGALAFSGCSASVQAPESAQHAQQTGHANTTSSTGGSGEPSETGVASRQDVDAQEVKAKAIAAGRPAAAFDIDCQVWEMPSAGTPGKTWANEIGSDWLAAHHAECPDQITLPNYFLDSFKKGSAGELIVIAEDEPGVVGHLGGLAHDVMEHTARSHNDLEQVTVTVRGREVTASSTRGQWEIGLPMHERAELAKANPRPPSTLTGQAWADEKMDQWLTKMRADNVAGLALGFRLIDSWSSPTPGELVVTLDASLPQSKVAQMPHWSIDQELQGIAVTILDNIYFDAPALERITAKLEGSAHAETVSRTDKWFRHG